MASIINGKRSYDAVSKIKLEANKKSKQSTSESANLPSLGDAKDTPIIIIDDPETETDISEHPGIRIRKTFADNKDYIGGFSHIMVRFN